jgi:hypothetical protein
MTANLASSLMSNLLTPLSSSNLMGDLLAKLSSFLTQDTRLIGNPPFFQRV